MTAAITGAPVRVPDLLANLALEIHYVSPSTLAAVGRKSRSHPKDQIRRIAESIRTLGFNVPILVDEDNKIIAGNARVEAAVQLGLAQVPVVALSHLTREQKRAFVIAENQLATLGGWNKDVLRIELQELSALDLDFSLEVTGFLEPQIDAIILGAGPSESRGDKLPPLASSRPAVPAICGCSASTSCSAVTRPTRKACRCCSAASRRVWCSRTPPTTSRSLGM